METPFLWQWHNPNHKLPAGLPIVGYSPLCLDDLRNNTKNIWKLCGKIERFGVGMNLKTKKVANKKRKETLHAIITINRVLFINLKMLFVRIVTVL